MSKTTNKFSPEVRTRAVRLVLGSRARTSVTMGGDGVDRGEDRLYGADAASSGSRRPRSTVASGSRRVDGHGRQAEGAGAREPRASAGQRDPAQGVSAYFAQAELDRRFKP